MYKRRMETIFPVFLYIVFMLMMIAVTIGAARSYKAISASSDQVFDETVFSDYIRNKVRTADEVGGITIRNDDGTLNKVGDPPASYLMIGSPDSEVATFIYSYDGKLMELTKNKSEVIKSSSGNEILSGSDFTVENVSDDLIKCSMKINNKKVVMFINRGAEAWSVKR